MKKLWCALFLLAAASLVPVPMAQDQEGCKDYPLFNRMPNFHITDCESAEFDSRKFPVGPPVDEMKPKHVEVEGAWFLLLYELDEVYR